MCKTHICGYLCGFAHNTKLFEDKCMHQYKQHVYFNFAANFKIVKVDIEKNAFQ